MAGDPSPIFSNLGRDADVMALIQQFVDKLDDRLASLREAFKRSDLAQVTLLAHQLKGAAGSHGFDIIGMAAADLEAAIRTTESVEQVGRCLDELTILCHRATANPPPG